ncbi:MAG: nicotinate (nicotinamide) nucleotide adenylyltransferase [Parafilimonas sp.]
MIKNNLTKTGLYFGSFNPIHIGHLIIAEHVLNNTDLMQIWFVVSPQNPLKTSASLLNEYHRLHLVQLAIKDNLRLKASDIEFNLPRPSYTINTLNYFAEKYSNHQFHVILGSDSFKNISQWKNYQTLLKNYKIIVYKRQEFDIKNPPQVIYLPEAPILDISSTFIRKSIREGKSTLYLLPDKVREEIERGGYYKNH